MPGLSLEDMRRHIAVIGKFSDEDGVDPIVETDYKSAHTHFQYYVYRGTIEEPINDRYVCRPVFYSAREVAKPELVKADERKKFTPIQLNSDLLKDILDWTTSESSTKIGQRLFLRLRKALDGVMPFLHPNFDNLLCESFIRFYGNYYHRDSFVTPLVLDKFIDVPEIGQRLLALLRGDSARIEQFSESLRETADKLGKAGDLPFPEEHVPKVIERIKHFRHELDAERGVAVTNSELESALDKDSRIIRLLDDLAIPNHAPEGVTPSAYLRHLFRVFHDRRREIEEFANNEAIFALMMSWFFSKIGITGSDKDRAKALEEAMNKFYKKDGGKRLSDAEKQESQKNFEDRRIKDRQSYKEDALKDVHDTLTKVFVLYRAEQYSPKRRYTREQLLEELGNTFRKILVLLISGLANCISDGMKVINEVRDTMRSYESIPDDADLTLEKLNEVLADGPDRIKKFLVEFSENNLTLKGTDLGDKFEEALFEFEIDTINEETKSFIDEKKGEIVTKLEGGKKTLVEGLKAMNEENTKVPASPPGGRLAMAAESAGEKEASPRHSAEEMPHEQPARTRSGGGGESRSSNEIDDSSSEDSDSHTSAGPDSATDHEAASQGHPGDHSSISSSNSPTKQGPLGPEMSLEELRTQHKEERGTVEDLFKELFDDKEFLSKREWAPQRAQMRALLFGWYLLAADRSQSSLDNKDVSLGTHFIVRMFQNVGASQKFEEEIMPMLEEGKEDREDADAWGVFEVPMGDIFEISGDNPSERLVALDACINIWENDAQLFQTLARQAAEAEGVGTLLEELGSLPGEGRVTLLNMTLEEYAECDRQVITAAPVENQQPDYSPPGIVYVAESATGVDDESSADLGLIAENLFDGEDSPLYRGNGRTNVQRAWDMATHSYPDGCVWSIPLFIGRQLSQDTRDAPERELPCISVDTPDLSAAVICLAGLRMFRGRWAAGRRIDDDLVALFGRYGMRVPRGLTLGDAWCAFLMEDKQLAAQFTSRFAFSVLGRRVASTMKNQKWTEVTEYNMAVDSALNDLAATYMEAPGSKRDVLRKRVWRVGDDDEPREQIPPGPGGLGAVQTLFVGKQRTSVAALFKLL